MQLQGIAFILYTLNVLSVNFSKDGLPVSQELLISLQRQISSPRPVCAHSRHATVAANQNVIMSSGASQLGGRGPHKGSQVKLKGSQERNRLNYNIILNE